MIFVTVGTHEQPFNRLIQKVDKLKRDGVIKDDVIIQTGFSTCKEKEFEGICNWWYPKMCRPIRGLLTL